MSVTALSVSSCTSAWSSLTSWPGWTNHSTTSASVRPSPMSGKRNSNATSGLHHASRGGRDPFGRRQVEVLGALQRKHRVPAGHPRHRGLERIERALLDERDDLEPGWVDVAGVRRLAVVFRRPDPAPVGDADHQRRREAVTGSMADPGDVADDRIEGGIGEPHELHLGHRSHPAQCQPQRRSRDPRLRYRRIDNPLLAMALLEAVGHPEHAAGPTHVLAQYHDARIAG